MSTLARLPKDIRKKKVSELTPEEKEILREWMMKHRSKLSLAMDIRKESKKIPVYTATWFYKPSRYDIPGVDTPEALPQYQKLGYKPKHKKKKETIEKTEENKFKTAINSYVSKLVEWVKKHGKKSGWSIVKIDEYPSGFDVKLKKYDPVYKTLDYYVYIILRPMTVDGEKKIVMDIMFSKDENRFLREQSIHYAYSPEELEKESVYKIVAGHFLGDYYMLENLKNKNNVFTDPEEALEHLKKKHVLIPSDVEKKIREWINSLKESMTEKTLVEKILDDIFDTNDIYHELKKHPFIYDYIVKGAQMILDNWSSYKNAIKDVYVRTTVFDRIGKPDPELISEYEKWFERQVSGKSGKELLNELKYLFSTDTFLSILYRIGNNLSLDPKDIYAENKKMLTELKEVLPKTEETGYNRLKTKAISPKYEKRLLSNIILRILLHPNIKEKLLSIKKELSDSLKTDYTVFTIESQGIGSRAPYIPSLYYTLKRAIPSIISDYETLHGNPRYIIKNFYEDLGLYGDSQKKVGIKPILIFKGIENGYPVYEYKILYNGKVIDHGIVKPHWQEIASSIASQIISNNIRAYLFNNNNIKI